MDRFGIAQPGELLVQVGVILGGGCQQRLLGSIELAQLAEVGLIRLQCLVEQRLALLHQLPQLDLLRLGPRIGLRRPIRLGLGRHRRIGLQRQREPLDGGIRIRDAPRLGAMFQAAHVEVGDLRLALLVVLDKGPQVRQSFELLQQDSAKIVVDLTGLQRFPGILVVGADLIDELLEVLPHQVLRLKLLSDVVDVTRQCRVLRGQLDQNGVHPRELALGLLGFCRCLFRRLTAFAVEQIVEDLQALADSFDIGRFLIAPCLQQLRPQRQGRKLLLEHRSLGAQRHIARLQYPLLGLRKRGTCIVLGRCLKLRRGLFASRCRLREALTDGLRALLEGCQTGLQVSALRIGRGQVRLLLLKQLLKHRQRGVGSRIKAIHRLGLGIRRQRRTDRLDLGRRALGPAPKRRRRCRVVRCRLNIAQGLAIQLDQLGLGLLGPIGRCLRFGDLRLQRL